MKKVKALILIAFIVLVGFGFYSLALIWFSREIQRLTFLQAQQQAQRTVRAITRSMPRAFDQQSLRLSAQQWADQALNTLVQNHENVVAAMVVDNQGIIVTMKIGGSADARLIRTIIEMGRNVQGRPEAPLLQRMRETNPELDILNFNILHDRDPVGMLRVFVDIKASQAAVQTAAARIAARLALALFAMIGVAGVALVIIRRQRRQAERLRMQRDRNEQLAYVGTLAAGLAHEIRNPINALAMQLEMLEEDLNQADGRAAHEPGAGRRVERIRRGLTNVEETVRGFLTYAAPDKQQPRLVDLHEIIEPLCRQYRQANPDARIDCVIPADLHAWCDPHALRQILDNLLNNALKVQRPETNPQVRIECLRRGHTVEILVDDAGPGVPPELREKIFECFWSGATEGTGLGLAIAQRLALMNGGELSVDPASSPWGGARFCLRLATHPTPAQ